MTDETRSTSASPECADDLGEDLDERGCTWLAPYVAVILVLLYMVFFVLQNFEPIDLTIFPMLNIKIRPPTLVFASAVLGIALTILFSWWRHRTQLQSREAE